jgi:hypothetical protein
MFILRIFLNSDCFIDYDTTLSDFYFFLVFVWCKLPHQDFGFHNKLDRFVHSVKQNRAAIAAKDYDLADLVPQIRITRLY